MRLNRAMPRPVVDSFASRLATARKARGLTQSELAEKAGMKQPDVSKMERGLILQTTGMARLAAAARVPAPWLELGEGSEPDWGAIAAVGEASMQAPASDKESLSAPGQTLADAFQMFLSALAAVPEAHRDELAQVLALLVKTGAQPYRQRLAELLLDDVALALRIERAEPGTVVVPMAQVDRSAPPSAHVRRQITGNTLSEKLGTKPAVQTPSTEQSRGGRK